MRKGGGGEDSVTTTIVWASRREKKGKPDQNDKEEKEKGGGTARCRPIPPGWSPKKKGEGWAPILFGFTWFFEKRKRGKKGSFFGCFVVGGIQHFLQRGKKGRVVPSSSLNPLSPPPSRRKERGEKNRNRSPRLPVREIKKGKKSFFQVHS